MSSSFISAFTYIYILYIKRNSCSLVLWMGTFLMQGFQESYTSVVERGYQAPFSQYCGPEIGKTHCADICSKFFLAFSVPI